MRALIVLMALGATAHADENLALSRAHYGAGIAYFDQGDYEHALGEFEAAAKFAPRPEFDFNIARCYELMGNAVNAVAHYRTYLEKKPHAADRAEVEDALSRLGHRIGRLKIVSTMPDTRLTVDGAPIALGSDRIVPVTIGSHAVVAARAGMPTTTQEVRVGAGETVTVTIDPGGRGLTTVPASTSLPRERPRGRWKLWLGVGLGAAAVAAVAVGLGVGLSSSSQNFWSQASASCSAPCKVVDWR